MPGFALHDFESGRDILNFLKRARIDQKMRQIAGFIHHRGGFKDDRLNLRGLEKGRSMRVLKNALIR
jgi:hypothetical protein